MKSKSNDFHILFLQQKTKKEVIKNNKMFMKLRERWNGKQSLMIPEII